MLLLSLPAGIIELTTIHSILRIYWNSQLISHLSPLRNDSPSPRTATWPQHAEHSSFPPAIWKQMHPLSTVRGDMDRILHCSLEATNAAVIFTKAAPHCCFTVSFANSRQPGRRRSDWWENQAWFLIIFWGFGWECPPSYFWPIHVEYYRSLKARWNQSNLHSSSWSNTSILSPSSQASS